MPAGVIHYPPLFYSVRGLFLLPYVGAAKVQSQQSAAITLAMQAASTLKTRYAIHVVMGKIRQADLARTDAFLACEKALVEDEPVWFKLQNGRWFAIWPVRDDLGAIRGQLNFRIDPKYPDFPSLSLIFEGHPVCRIDTAPQSMVKLNPPWAFGCPPTVTGNHVHTWEDNREFILSVDNWLLQARQQVEPAVKRVPHMLRWFAHHINLGLYGSQFSFDFNPKQDMFGGEVGQ